MPATAAILDTIIATMEIDVRKALLVFECTLFMVLGLLMLAFGGTVFTLSSGQASWRDVMGVILMFLIAPVVILILVALSIAIQRKNEKAVCLPPLFALLATLLMLHSWGMHAFFNAAVGFNLASLAVALFGFWVAIKRGRCD